MGAEKPPFFVRISGKRIGRGKNYRKALIRQMNLILG